MTESQRRVLPFDTAFTYSNISISNYDYAKYSVSLVASHPDKPLSCDAIPRATDVELEGSLLSKKYQKYRTLILKKSSSTSLAKAAKPAVTLASLPDEVIQLIFSYAISDAQLMTPASTATLAKRPYQVSFSAASKSQVRIKKPKSGVKRDYQRYMNQVLANYKQSKYYTSCPKRNAVLLLYVCRRFYTLALPLVYKSVRFHSTYRLAQFVTTIRRNNKLGLLVEQLSLSDLDVNYYLTFELSSSTGEMVLTEKEKNRLEHLINNPTLNFDGTFVNIDFDAVAHTRLNINDYVLRTGKLPLCFIEDSRPPVHSDLLFDFEDFGIGFKKKIVLGGWRDWKSRDDPLYMTFVPSIEWIKNASSPPPAMRRDSLGRTALHGSHSSVPEESLKTKVRKIVGRFTRKGGKKVASQRKVVVTKGTKAQSPATFGKFSCPVQNKLLKKYSTKDVPIGLVMHLLKICGNLRRFNMDKVVLASDYEITSDAIDDYGILIRNAASAKPLHIRSHSVTGLNSTLEKIPMISKSKSIHDFNHYLQSTDSIGKSSSSLENLAPRTAAHEPREAILQEISSAYGVSIYSQFNSVVKKKPVRSKSPDSLDDKSHLSFYKDSYGYSSSCNYKLIQNSFYKDFWGYANFNNRFKANSRESIELARNPVDGRSSDSLVLLVSEPPRSSFEEKGKDRVKVEEKKISFNQTPEIDIIEEEEDEAAEVPTLQYITHTHSPLVVSADNQQDRLLYLSDVKKSNNWEFYRLAKVANATIILSLAGLQKLESVSLISANWINTKDVLMFLDCAESVKSHGLQKLDLRESGMRRDLHWAREGTVQELKRSFKLAAQEPVPFNVGRFYSRF